jgi:hypothetical protein
MEKLVKFETAKLAKEKGFDEKCDFLYNAFSFEYPKQKTPFANSDPHINGTELIARPTQDQLKNWLRKTHFLYALVIPTVTCCWTFKVIDIQCDPQNEIERPPYSGVDAYDYNTYEEAMEVGLNEALNKIKKSK